MSSTQQIFKSGKARGEGEGQANQLAQSARDTADSISNKASETAQSARENKEQASGFLAQTGEQVMQMAHDAADAVKNAVGIGGDTTATPTPGGTTTKSTTTTIKH